MGRAALSHLLKNPKRLHSTKYGNPEQDPDVFYQFVEDTASEQGVEFEFTTITPKNNFRLSLEGILLGAKTGNIPYAIMRSIDLFLQIGIADCRMFYDDKGRLGLIKASAPGYTINPISFLLRLVLSGKTHEYLHAYEALLIDGYKKRGIVSRDAPESVLISDLLQGLNPFRKAVFKRDELMDYEQTIIKLMLKAI